MQLDHHWHVEQTLHVPTPAERFFHFDDVDRHALMHAGHRVRDRRPPTKDVAAVFPGQLSQSVKQTAAKTTHHLVHILVMVARADQLNEQRHSVALGQQGGAHAMHIGDDAVGNVPVGPSARVECDMH